MSRLADHHVARPRLTSRLAEAAIGVVWAGGGCGKSALATELRDQLNVAAIEARLDPGDHAPDRLAARLRRGLRRAGRSDALAAMNEELGAPGAALEALADWLAGEPEPVIVIVDDVHHADREASELLARFAADLPRQHRLLLMGRGPVPGLEPLSRLPRAISLDTADLAFTADEVAQLARDQAGIALDSGEAEALRRATGGWVAAIVLAIGRLAEADDRTGELRELTEQSSILAHLIGELLESLEAPVRDGVVQLAHLPLISSDLGAAVTGGDVPELIARVLAAGVPLARVREGWWELAGGVQDLLVEIGPLNRDVAAAAAEVYMAAGEDRAALTVLLRAGLAERAAALVAGLPSDRLDRLDYSELGALVEVLPDEALEHHPRVLIHFARACQPAAQVKARNEALDRARTIVGAGDARVRREIEVEIGLDLIRDERPDEAEALVGAVLADCLDDELATKARGLDALGRVAALRGDDQSLLEAETLLSQALVLCRALGQEGWAAQVLIALVDRIYYARGQHALAMERIDELLSGLTGRSGHRAVVLTFRAQILIDCGRFAEAESTLAEARRLIQLSGDRRAAGYAAWDEARLASQRGEAAATLAALAETEAHRTDWFDHSTGAEFLADAADLLDRVGEHDAAAGYLARARERAAEAELPFAVAEAAILARSGDADAARTALSDALESPRLHRREIWRLTLLSAYAALRSGDPEAGALAAAAFDEAATLGIASLPLAREPQVAERLLELAASAGSASAQRLAADRPPLEITLLGRFGVSRGGQALAVPEGRPRTLVKLVAASGGAIPAEEAVEALWPGGTPDSGRRGLRNVLNRLRRSAGELVVRDGADLRLPEGAQVDVVAFDREARMALEGEPDPTAARRALALHRGELLADERYDSWAAPARERTRDLYARLLDLLAEQVEGEGELDEALRLLEQAIEVDPYDDRRYLISARILAAQGRYGSATQMLTRGAETMRSLGLAVPAAFDKLAESTRSRAAGEIP